MASRIKPFSLEKFKLKYWVFKGIVDLVLLAFGVGAIVFTYTQIEIPETSETLKPFKAAAYVFSVITSSVWLVMSTEVAWAIRQAAVQDAGDNRPLLLRYVADSNSLPINAFDQACLHTDSPNYVVRLVFSLVNSIYFLLLPLQMLASMEFKRRAWYQWLAFSPSILLAFTLYGLLVILVESAASVLEIIFAVVSLRVFGGLSDSLIAIVFSRSKSVGSIVKNYTVPAAGVAKVVTYVMGVLVDRSCRINLEQSTYRGLSLSDKLYIIAQCLLCHGKDREITVVGIPNGDNVTEALSEFLDLVEGYAFQVHKTFIVKFPPTFVDAVQNEAHQPYPFLEIANVDNLGNKLVVQP